MHTHTHTHVYKRIDVQIHTHMHIYTNIMSAHIHTCTYIHTRIQNVQMNTRKARLKRRRGSDCANSQLDTKKFYPSPCPHHDSAPSRPHPLICTGAEPIHPIVHASYQLGHGPRNEVIFLRFWRGFSLAKRKTSSQPITIFHIHQHDSKTRVQHILTVNTGY